MEKIRLGEIFIYLTKSKIKAGEGQKIGKYKFFTSSNIQDKYIDKYLFDGEYLIFGTGGKASVNYCNDKFSTSTDNFIVKTTPKILTKYVYFYLKNNMEILEQGFKGVGIKHISKEYINKINIPIYDIETQKQIIIELDRIQDIIDAREKQIIELDNLIKSQFVEIFGDIFCDENKYSTVKLDEIANVGSSHRVFTTEFVNKGIPFYRGTEIGQLANGIIPEETYYISEEHYNKICDENTKPKIGDLLLPSICDKGQVWMVNSNKPFYYKDGRVLSISLKIKNMNYTFFHQYIKFKTEVDYPKLGSGSTFAEFKIFLLKNMDIMIPPIELQNQFAEIVKQIDKQKFEMQESLKETQKLQESLMNKYFGGN